MAGKIQFKTKQRIGKTSPAVGDVHVTTALGNQNPRAKAKDFLTVIGEIAGGARIVQLPTLQAATSAIGKLSVGDRVSVKPGMGHDHGHEGKVGTVAETDGKALGVKFDGDDEIHRWYTAEELVAKKGGLTTVWFMRHGATRFNNQTDMSQDRVRSWNDVPLTEEGREDAEKAGKKLEGEGVKVIVSSSLGRAKETARIVKKAIGDKDIEVISTPKMLPWNLGKFTGMTTDEAHDGIKHYIENPDEEVPKGESFNDFRSRAFAGMAWALKKAGRRKLLVISHHRNERLWATSGEPPRPDAKIDAEKFLKPGEDPGDVTTFEFSLNALQGKPGKAGEEAVGKVWDSNADLPDGVRSSLPEEAQTVFRRVANDRMQAGASEESAIRQAWTAVKNGWRKEGDEWVRKFAGDGESLIVFTAQQIDLAKQLPSDAIQGPGAPDPGNASLQLFPLDSDPAWAKTPFPWDQNALGKLKPEQMKPFLGALTNQDALPVRLFHMKTLVALQDRVNPDKVQSMVEDEPDDLPVVARVNGRNVIVDGHHRATARVLMGRKTMQVHFINLDNPAAEAKEDDAEASNTKKRGRSFVEVVTGWFSKVGPEDEARDDRGRWTSGGGDSSKPEASGRIAGVPFEGTAAEFQRLKDARAAGAGKAEIERLIAQMRSGGVPSDGAKNVTLEHRIRSAYLDAGGRYGARVLIADIRDRLPNVSRTDLDRSLKEMSVDRNSNANIYRNDNRSTISAREAAGALHVGGEPRHLLYITGPVAKEDDAEAFRAAIKSAEDIKKREFSRTFEVKKVDEDQQLVFGWASISSVGGEYVVDKQDDIIPEDELEKAAYDFVLYHRSQGDMHERMGVGRCVESMMFTKQKQDALGIDLGLVGWWVGFKVDDDSVWKRIKAGDLPEFSIGGKATREAA